ncbi:MULTISPECIES: DsbE family thiol:disulfide interchange protein [Methylotenera]|uniref:DsbE family thiol:disulfide interchange protein n=1 Tax=Methylotenera TaxID=359407 RepID=UPI00035E3FE5|nr:MULTISPECIES: DsbE family thiol:disulfide interchange protein [Methylotenera]
MKRLLILGPLILFVVLVGFLAVGLQHDPSDVPSPLVGKPAPQFSLPRLDDAQQSFSPKEMLDQVWLFNVWASWCAACREEHPLLLELAKTRAVPLYGINYKDTQDAAQKWLKNGGGDPYTLSVMDETGRVGIDYGVYGVPETYLIDKKGIIRYKQTGAITSKLLTEKILPLVKRLQAE